MEKNKKIRVEICDFLNLQGSNTRYAEKYCFPNFRSYFLPDEMQKEYECSTYWQLREKLNNHNQYCEILKNIIA